MSKRKLEHMFQEIININDDINAVSLCTADGFTIQSVLDGKRTIEEDKLSAVTSSLSSLSNAASQQIINAQLVNTVIETQNGDILIVRTKYSGKQAVLSVITGAKQNLGKARYYAIKLAEAIVNIPVESQQDSKIKNVT